jgi:hypothetical protein
MPWLDCTPLRLVMAVGRKWPLEPPQKFYRFADRTLLRYQNADFLADSALQAEEMLERMYYLGPLRQSARRVYQSSGQTPPHVGALGEHTIAALLALTEQGRKLNHGPNKKRQPSDDAANFLAGPVLVEEKLDGANLGFSVAAEGVLLAQNRGHYLLAPYSGQFARLRQWLAAREERLLDALGDDLIAFGEWCAARHSLAYSTLPDWWLLFDIYDRRFGRFWSTARRNAWAVELGLLTVPPLLHGKTSLPDLQRLVCTG